MGVKTKETKELSRVIKIIIFSVRCSCCLKIQPNCYEVLRMFKSNSNHNIKLKAKEKREPGLYSSGDKLKSIYVIFKVLFCVTRKFSGC